MTSHLVKLAFPARAEFLLLPRLALSGIARGVPMSEELLADLKLAVTEACGNAVRHGYPDGEGMVEVAIEIDPGAWIRITVEDHGVGTPGESDLRSENGDLDPAEGGMGLTIIRAIADDVELDHRSGEGTRLVMRKSLAEAEETAPMP